MGSRLSLHKFIAMRLALLAMFAGIFLLMQTVMAAHVHHEDVDAFPETSCNICAHTNQNDDIDVPVFAATPDNGALEKWTAPIGIKHVTTPIFKAKARAPPYC